MQICAILITRNNESTIENLVLRCRHVIEPDVFVVDRDSVDDTVQRAIAAGAMHLDAAQGRESVVMAALREVGALGYTHAVVLRASDASHHAPEQISRFVNAAFDNPGGILIASGHGAATRRLANVIASISGWRRFEDAASTFRLYPVEETLGLGCRESDDHVDTEALVRASWAGIPTCHIPTAREWDRTAPAAGLSPGFGLRMLAGMLIRSPRLLWRRLSA